MAKRNFNGIILLVFVIGFPLVSWYYLKRGIEFRRERIQSISERQAIPVGSLMSTAGDTIKLRRDSTDEVLHHFIFLYNNSELESVIEDLRIQFTGIPRFRFLGLFPDTEDSVESMPEWADALIESSELIQFLSTQNNGVLDNRVYLVDHNGDLRRSYPLNSRDSMVLFVQEAAILLPAKSGQELKFERKKEM